MLMVSSRDVVLGARSLHPWAASAVDAPPGLKQLTLNQRVPGSSPGAPTKLFNSLGILRASHSDKRSAAIPTNWLLLFAPRDASWSPRSAACGCALHRLATGAPTDDDLRRATQRR